LEQIAGSRLLDQIPDINLPPFNIFQAPARNFIAEDSKIALNMQKSIDQVKNSDIIMCSLADSIILGNQEIKQTGVCESSIGFTVIATSIMIGLLIFQLAYVTIRVRMLAVMLECLPKADAQENVEPEEQTKFKFNYSPSSNEAPNQIKSKTYM
jgi:hypothetical protein